MPRVILDTCVLVPGLQRDFLLQMAAGGAFSPHWSSGTIEELDYVLARIHDRRGIADSSAVRSRLIDRMNMAFPEALIDAPKHAQYPYDLVDPHDAHVVHAAIVARANIIATDDVRSGFTTSKAVLGSGVAVLNISAVADQLVTSQPQIAIESVLQISRRSRSPHRSGREIVTTLRERYGLEAAAKHLEAALPRP